MSFDLFILQMVDALAWPAVVVVGMLLIRSAIKSRD
jgi:hypothetical protein